MKLIRTFAQTGIILGTLVLLLSACSQPSQHILPEDDNLPGQEQEEKSVPTGRLLIRIDNPQAARTLSPNIEAFSKVIIAFIHQDGERAPEKEIRQGNSLEVALKPGSWTLIATGYIESPDVEAPVPVIQGSVKAVLAADKSTSATITLDAMVAENGEAGTLTYTLEFPRDRVQKAVLEFSTLGIEGESAFFKRVDLWEQAEKGIAEGRLSLPAGYYQMVLRLEGPHTSAERSEIVHIYPSMTTETPRYHYGEDDFPTTITIPELTGTAALREYLEGMPENTAETPYLIKLKGVNLESKDKTGETLRTLYEALSRFVKLDLSDCAGENIPPTIAVNQGGANKIRIVSLILPETITRIDSAEFSGYSSLESIEAPGVVAIGKSVFKGCERLKSVSFPALRIIDNDSDQATSGAFRDCAALIAVSMPKLETVGNYAFYGCGALASLSLPQVTVAGKSAFKNCGSLIEVSLPRLRTIGNEAFGGVKSLEYLTLGAEPPVLEGKAVFPAGTPSQAIYVPQEAVSAYQDTKLENWDKLKEKVRAPL